ncbi:hypothetical protein GCM10023340_15920 [Nocardioides marinquilinus]|uniref:Uncharacterized protein n=1 Tax=Nocardioides marinquilinus TaxID=1210400 RepID=A0ABP9PHJ4_9ACTN
MKDDELLRVLLDDVEETYATEGWFPLYNLAWALRGILPSIPPERIELLSRQAYDLFTRRHDVRLVWGRWPLSNGEMWPAQPGTPLDFDLDPEGDVNEPLLVLVPA